MPKSADVLHHLDRGMLRIDVDEAVQSVVEGCLENDKKGKVTITLEIVPVREDRVDIVSKIKADRPTADGVTTFYRTIDGELSRRDPQQPTLDEVER